MAGHPDAGTISNITAQADLDHNSTVVNLSSGTAAASPVLPKEPHRGNHSVARPAGPANPFGAILGGVEKGVEKLVKHPPHFGINLKF